MVAFIGSATPPCYVMEENDNKLGSSNFKALYIIIIERKELLDPKGLKTIRCMILIKSLIIPIYISIYYLHSLFVYMGK